MQRPVAGTERVRPLRYTQVNTPRDRKLKTLSKCGGKGNTQGAMLQQVCFFLEVGAPLGCLASTSEGEEKFHPARPCHLTLLAPQPASPCYRRDSWEETQSSELRVLMSSFLVNDQIDHKQPSALRG